MKGGLFLSILASSLLGACSACAAILHVDLNSTNPVPPYTNWATAATTIQDAVDAASDGDTVRVTDGVYRMGGRQLLPFDVTNRVLVTNALMLTSVNGASHTLIEGNKTPPLDPIRCVWLGNGATLSGFTLTNGGAGNGNYAYGCGVSCESTDATVSNCVVTGNAGGIGGGGCSKGTLQGCLLAGNDAGAGGGAYNSILNSCIVSNNTAGSGGGVYYCTLSNCIVVGNSARYGGGGHHSDMVDCTITDNHAEGTGSPVYNGGGVYYGGLSNCRITGNSAISFGGGAFSAALTNCTIAGNAAGYSGGAYPGTVRNCIIYFNTASVQDPNYGGLGASADHTCTTPPPPGTANITNAPLFVDTNNWADLRLQSNSPCINAGNNAHVTATNDLAGQARIAGGAVDMGAYEFQSPLSLISYAYLQQYGLPTDGSADDQDGDGDKATTWQEWKMWTIPTNGLSVLRMLRPASGTNGTQVSWQSVAGHRYTLERASHAGAAYESLQSGIAGLAGTTVFIDTTATNGDAFLYRVSVPE